MCPMDSMGCPQTWLQSIVHLAMSDVVLQPRKATFVVVAHLFGGAMAREGMVRARRDSLLIGLEISRNSKGHSTPGPGHYGQ